MSKKPLYLVFPLDFALYHRAPDDRSLYDSGLHDRPDDRSLYDSGLHDRWLDLCGNQPVCRVHPIMLHEVISRR